MSKLISIAAIMIALSIGGGAFAAHGLKDKLDAYSLDVFQKGAFYHLTQAIGLLLIAILGTISTGAENTITKIFFTLLAGIIVFSGSLYILAITQIKWLGAITPIGGSAMIIAWVWLAIVAFRS